MPKIVFICGGKPTNFVNREKIERYFEKNLERFLTFRAENAWNVIQENLRGTNALELEEWLADFSDVVIILVESFGTVAELGAFSMNSILRKKVLPILDTKYEGDDSFINTGPIKWIDKESKYSPSIYVDFSLILTCMDEVEQRISKRYWEYHNVSRTYGKYGYTKKVLLYFFIYVLASLGPIDIDEIVEITNNLISYQDKKNIQFIVSIGVALKIFQKRSVMGNVYYTCSNYRKLFSSPITKDHLKRIQNIRARNLSSLLKIKDFVKVMDSANVNS